jgi:protein tyrosine/serine phosphatase
MRDTGTPIPAIAPILNFGEVIPGKLYRSAQPTLPYEWRWLRERAHIRTVACFRKDNHIDAKEVPPHMLPIHFAVPDHAAPSDEEVLRWFALLDTLRAADAAPLLGHCLHGHGRTSLFMVLARMYLSGWDLADAL